MRTILYSTVLLILLSSCGPPKPGTDIIRLDHGWKFQPGDDTAWAAVGYDDSKWQKYSPADGRGILPETNAGKDDYVWYRIRFILPEKIREKAFFGEKIQISLGKITGSDQLYLNGKLIGQNNLVIQNNTGTAPDLTIDSTDVPGIRNYVIPADDKRLRWDRHNILAIRIRHQGIGDLFHIPPTVSMVDIKDFLDIETHHSPFEIKGENFVKNIRLVNHHEYENFYGILSIRATGSSSGKEIFRSVDHLMIRAGEFTDHIFTFNAPHKESYLVEYIFKTEDSHYPVYKNQLAPYILSPPITEAPRINGPEICGIELGKYMQWRFPVSGARPIIFSARNLPDGVVVDPKEGILQGRINIAGEYEVTLIASNTLGETSKTVRFLVGDGNRLTPPMGWNSKKCKDQVVHADKILASAGAMVTKGLSDFGWTFINLYSEISLDRKVTDTTLQPKNRVVTLKDLETDIQALGLNTGSYPITVPRYCGSHSKWYIHDKSETGSWIDKGITLPSNLLTPDEHYTYFSLKCLLNAPLLLTNDLNELDDFTISLLTNREVLAVNRDISEGPAYLAFQRDSIHVWLKNMSDGSYVAGIINLDKVTRKISLSFQDLGLLEKYTIQDLWRGNETGRAERNLEADIYPHGILLIRLHEEP
ncbi:MAG: hypothetical protein WD052_11680 [Bacteroidales bacterium]